MNKSKLTELCDGILAANTEVVNFSNYPEWEMKHGHFVNEIPKLARAAKVLEEAIQGQIDEGGYMVLWANGVLKDVERILSE